MAEKKGMFSKAFETHHEEDEVSPSNSGSGDTSAKKVSVKSAEGARKNTKTQSEGADNIQQQSKATPSTAAGLDESALSLTTTRKAFTIPLFLDLAMKELKNKRNLQRQISREKGRVTDDDIIREALEMMFAQQGEFESCRQKAIEILKSHHS